MDVSRARFHGVCGGGADRGVIPPPPTHPPRRPPGWRSPRACSLSEAPVKICQREKAQLFFFVCEDDRNNCRAEKKEGGGMGSR